MYEDYQPKHWHVLTCILLAAVAAMVPEKIMAGWKTAIVGGLLAVGLGILFLLVHYTVTGNLDRLRRSAALLIESVQNVDDHRLRTIGIHFPEWRIKPLDEDGHIVFTLEDTSITRECLIKIMSHPETNNIQIAPVRSFPERKGERLMAAEFHRLAQRRGWAEEWRGSATSKWKMGWSATRILIMYGCDEVVKLPNLNEAEPLELRPGLEA